MKHVTEALAVQLALYIDGKLYNLDRAEDGSWHVGKPGQAKPYEVRRERGQLTCTCPARGYGHGTCRHIRALTVAGLLAR
jgi:hypothetical protein